ncbi:hypothetical protein Trydic_g18879 [Trypoxylus dichotomus]
MKKSLLSEKHMRKPFAWAKENLDRDWRNVIFTDKASVYGYTPIRRSWLTLTNRSLQRTLKHPVVHLWGCFSDFGALYLFTFNLNVPKIYEKCLLPTAERCFLRKNDDWILQEDNHLKHRSKLCTEWKEQSGIVTLD